jgi:hypothetical protein
MKSNHDELLMIIKYNSFMNDRFIYHLNLYDTDELRKLIRYYDINIKEELMIIIYIKLSYGLIKNKIR